MIIAAVDIETVDPNLKDLGPGAIRRDGYVIGVGIYCPDKGINGFFSALDDVVRDILADPHIIKVFHNGIYDCDWLINYCGLTINGRIDDTMTREALLDAYADSYSLDNCCKRHGITGKNKGETIDEWWKNHGGKGKAIKNLDKIPVSVVGEYCKQDCKATYDLYKWQQGYIDAQNLGYANDIECRLMPVLMMLRRNGIKINEPERDLLSIKLNNYYHEEMAAMCRAYGMQSLSVNRAKDLEYIWSCENIPIVYTDKGFPSFKSEILQSVTNPVAEKILELKGLQKLLSTYLDGGLRQTVNGYLHSVFHPMKGVDGGALTGRFASSNINLQQIPSREDKFGPQVRSLFIPDDGCILGAFDYKQIEYRVFTHYASGEAGREAQQKFIDNPLLDYHQMTIDLMGWGYLGHDGRKLAKNFNFGSIYGMGYRSFAHKYKKILMKVHPDVPESDIEYLAQSLMNEYYAKVPFVKPTCDDIMRKASSRGYVRTLAGRRQRMPYYIDKKGRRKPATYKEINYLVQGSATGDIPKKAVVDAYDAGIWDVLKLHILVHDEFVFSIPQNKEAYEACRELDHIMCTPYKLKVPLLIDTEIGPDWGHCDLDNWKEFERRFV